MLSNRLKTLLFFSFIIVCEGQPINNYNGNINMYYISKLSDQSIINLPYRIFSLNIDHQNDDIMLKSSIAAEHQIKKDTDFLSNSSPTDFNLDLRELYIQLFTSWGEIKIGKMIHSWGNADENSPIDILSPFDYYYTFETGVDKKLGIFSTAFDVYMYKTKLGAVFSPIHNTHRTPQDDDDFPIKLPTSPSEEEFMNLKGLPYEIGLYLNRSFNFGDISLNYFNGYDRLFNLSGVNVYGAGADLSFSIIDIIYGFRKTEMIGIGTTLLLGNIALRADAALFNSKDKNDTDDFNSRLSSYQPQIYDSLKYSYPLKEQARYVQSTIQLEVELPFDINFTGQFFHYDTLDYSSDSLPINDDISIPNLEISVDELDPKNIFTPGYGSQISVLTKRAAIISLEKKLLDDQLILSLSSIFDIYNNDYSGTVPGSILSFESTYKITEDLKLTIGYTKIRGDKNHPLGENYRLYIMEDFSHWRTNLKYSF